MAHYLDKAAEEDVRSIRVWGTVGNKTDMVLEWVRPRSQPLARPTKPI
ncbi:MAG TPA: hypothetical protein VGF39_06125 [Stellaceae bacterium]